MQEVTRRWRYYRTAGGQRPVHDFLMALPEDRHAAISEAMADVRDRGYRTADVRKLHGRIWEVRVDQGEVIHRVLFASVGRRGRVLLALDVFTKKTERTPSARIRLAENRLRDWELRG